MSNEYDDYYDKGNRDNIQEVRDELNVSTDYLFGDIGLLMRYICIILYISNYL